MDWALLPAWTPYLVAAALMMLLAGWLAWLDFSNRAHRVFVALLFLRAVTMLLNVGRGIATTAEEETYLLRVLPYFQLPVGILALCFAALYPRPLRLFRGNGLWLLVGGLAAIEVLYLVRHDVVYTLGPAGASTPPALAAGTAVAFLDVGPLFFLTIQPLAFAIVALVLAIEWTRAPADKPWLSGFLVYGGFALNAAFDGTLQAANAWRLVASGAEYPWFPWGWTLALLPALSLVPALVSIVVVGLHARRAEGAARRHALRLVGAAPLAIASALALSFLGPLFINGPVAQLVLGLWRLALPVLVTYALVRHQLFDIDVKVKIALRASTIAAVFLTVFFTVSEIAANFIQESVGTVLGIAAAVILAFALRPVERFAETLAHRIMPGTKPIETMALTEREVFYREQLELALQDGNLGTKERAMLDKLRARLGLSADEVARAETGLRPAVSAA